jgi:hypothetical protein
LPLAVFRERIPGAVLQLRFCVGGGRLVVVTTEEVGRWDRGRTRLTRELYQPITVAAISLDGEVVAVEAAGLVHVIDLRTGSGAPRG